MKTSDTNNWLLITAYQTSRKTSQDGKEGHERHENNELLNDLYDRIEKEGGNVQFVSGVSDYIDDLIDYDNRPFYG